MRDSLGTEQLQKIWHDNQEVEPPCRSKGLKHWWILEAESVPR